MITVDHMLRYNPIVQSFIRLGKSGCFGRLRHAVVNNYAQDAALPADHWFWKEELSGGIFIEHGVHFFDILNAISAQHYSQVYGCSRSRNEAQRDQVVHRMNYRRQVAHAALATVSVAVDRACSSPKIRWPMFHSTQAAA